MSTFATFPLFPVLPDGTCSCGQTKCLSNPKGAGKHPALPWSKLELGESWRGSPGSGTGICTGYRSGFFVVDLDTHDGKDGAAALLEMGDIPRTYTVTTPSGGLHLYFQLPSFPVRKSIGELGAGADKKSVGIDIIGEGGYVVAPGSKHRNGGTYEVAVDAPIACAPEWLLSWPGLRGREFALSEAGGNAPIPVNIDTEEGKKRLRAGALLCTTMPESVAGNNGSGALWALSLALVRELELPIEAAVSLVLDVYNPRCTPPWSEFEVLHKIEGARDDSDKATGILKTEAEAEVLFGKMRTTARGLRPGVTPTRRIHRPSHEYSFVVGAENTDLCNEPEVRSLTNIANKLSTSADWDGVLQWDELHNRVVAVDPPVRLDAETKGLTKGDVLAIRQWLEAHGDVLQKAEARDVIEGVAKCIRFNPIKEWLLSLPRYSGAYVAEHLSERPLGRMASEAYGVSLEGEDAQPLAQTFFTKMLVAAVRRVLTPGIKHDSMLVLCGSQDKLKSTSFDVLFAPWFRDDMPEIDSGRDVSMAFRGYWAVEFQEVDQWKGKQKGKLKKVLSTRTERFRAFGAEDSLEEHRQVVLLGTTNVEEYLSDETGERRQWPIRVTQDIDLGWLKRNKEAIWADAVALALLPAGEAREVPAVGEGFNHWLTSEESKMADAARERHQERDSWHEKVMDFITGKPSVSAEEVFDRLGCQSDGSVDLMKYTPQVASRIVKTLTRLGCTPRRLGGKRRYDVPMTLSNRLPTTETPKATTPRVVGEVVKGVSPARMQLRALLAKEGCR